MTNCFLSKERRKIRFRPRRIRYLLTQVDALKRNEMGLLSDDLTRVSQHPQTFNGSILHYSSNAQLYKLAMKSIWLKLL
jgi:hypothetical protein